MYNTSKEDLEFADSVKRDKHILEANFCEAFKKLEETLNLFSETINVSNTYSLEKNKIFWNTARYINIISLDLKMLAKHQAFAETEWERRLFARQVSLLIYEAMDDILSLLGREFRIIANEYSVVAGFPEKLNEARSLLNTFKSKYSDKLKSHRNVAIAHRDKDTAEQLKQIYSISWVESVNICAEFDRILNSIGHFLEEIMKRGITDGIFKFDAH